MPNFTLPSDTHVAGDTGHVTDHNKIVDSVSAAVGINVLNTAYSGGADPTGAADSAAAIQAAITAAQNAGGAPVIIPAGTYKLGSPLSVSALCSIVGAGRDATTLQLANAVNDYAIKFTQVAGAITGAKFADFTISGNAANQTAGGGISAVGAVQCSFERIHFTSCYNWGLFLQAQPGGAFGHHNRVDKCLFDNAIAAGNGGGVNITSSDENFFTSCDFEYLGGTVNPVGSNPVMLLDQAGLQQITACCFVGSRANTTNVIGIRCQNANQTRVIGCTFDGVGADGVWITGTDCVVAGNELTSVGDQGTGGAAGVHLEFGTARCIVANNNLSTSGTNGRTGYLIREEATGGSGPNLIEGNTLRVNGTAGTALLSTAGAASIVRSNVGYNPVGALTAPGIPATTADLVNPFNIDCSVFITGGTVTVIKVNGVTTGLTTGQFTVPAAGKINLTYSVAPTWTWIGW